MTPILGGELSFIVSIKRISLLGGAKFIIRKKEAFVLFLTINAKKVLFFSEIYITLIS